MAKAYVTKSVHMISDIGISVIAEHQNQSVHTKICKAHPYQKMVHFGSQTAPGYSNIMSFSYAFVYVTRPIYSAQSCRQWFFHNCEIKNLSSNFRKEQAHKKIGNEGVREGERDLFSLLKLQLKHLQPHQQPPGEQLVPWWVHQEGPISHFLPEVALLQELPVDLGGWSRQVKGNFSIW